MSDWYGTSRLCAKRLISSSMKLGRRREIAFSEYAMGLGYEIISQDPNIPADDLLYEVRSSPHRLAAAAAVLYR